MEDLPNACSRWLLRNFDLETLLTIHITIPAWRPAQQEEMSRKRTLSVIIGQHQLALEMALTVASPSALDTNIVTEETCQRRLLLPADRAAKRRLRRTIEKSAVVSFSFNERKVSQWTADFRHITRLTVIIRKLAPSQALKQVATSLIATYSHQLTILKLWVLYLQQIWEGGSGGKGQQQCLIPCKQAHRLVEVINSCQKLRELELHLHNDIEADDEGEPFRFQFRPELMRQLQTFSLFTKDRFSLIADALVHLDEEDDEDHNQTLPLKIEYGNSDLLRDLPALLALSPRLASRFTHLSRAFIAPLKSFSQLQAFCRLFTSLRSFRVELGSTSSSETETIPSLRYCQLIKALAPMSTSLTYLELSLRAYPDLMATLMKRSEEEEKEEVENSLVPLSSVQVLFIRLHVPLHDLLFTFQLATVFPNLSKLHLEVLRDYDVPGCSSCAYTDYHRTASEEQRQECHQALLSTLLQTGPPTLQVVLIPPYTRWYSSDECRKEEEKAERGGAEGGKEGSAEEESDSDSSSNKSYSSSFSASKRNST